MKELKGTEKQIKWANDILKRVNDIIDNHSCVEKIFEHETFTNTPNKANAETFKELYTKFMDFHKEYAQSEDAKFIIENRLNINDLDYIFSDLFEDEKELQKHIEIFKHVVTEAVNMFKNEEV